MAILYFMEVKMTSVIEKIVAIIAPHRCLVCGIEDNILCVGCYHSHILRPDSFCALCGAASQNWQLCTACQAKSGLTHVWVGSNYEAQIAKMLKMYKFERAREAYKPLSQLLQDSLPYDNWQIVPVPTAPTRIRQRGYDQTLLLAKSLAATRGLPLTPLLRRARDGQQVGSSRKQRLQQSKNAFYIVKPELAKNARIVLVDDVCTTGATLSAAAHLLRQAGASQVNAVVCAWQPPLKYNKKRS